MSENISSERSEDGKFVDLAIGINATNFTGSEEFCQLSTVAIIQNSIQRQFFCPEQNFFFSPSLLESLSKKYPRQPINRVVKEEITRFGKGEDGEKIQG